MRIETRIIKAMAKTTTHIINTYFYITESFCLICSTGTLKKTKH